MSVFIYILYYIYIIPKALKCTWKFAIMDQLIIGCDIGCETENEE